MISDQCNVCPDLPKIRVSHVLVSHAIDPIPNRDAIRIIKFRFLTDILSIVTHFTIIFRHTSLFVYLSIII